MTVNVDAIETDSISPKTPLGEVTINELASNSVNITGGTMTGVAASFTSGTITGITDLAVADGGTGASTAAGAATNLGLGTGDSPQFTAVNIGHATDSTLTRTAAGRIAIEGLGIVKGPASSTDNAVARFDSTTGELVQNSAVIIDDSNNVSGVVGLTMTGAVVGATDIDGDTVSGAMVATQAEQETGSATDKLVTPGRQHFHPGHPKCWAYVTVSGGTPTLQTSYNITSITDTSTGQLTITIATDFSTANWCSLISIEKALAAAHGWFNTATTKAAGSIVLHATFSVDVAGAQPNFTDPDAWNFMGLGDLA